MSVLELRNIMYMFATTSLVILLCGYIISTLLDEIKLLNTISLILVVLGGSLIVTLRYEVYIKSNSWLYSDAGIDL